MRIGAVRYLNTKPLVADLPRRLPSSELLFDLPSRLADRLAADDLDVALIPVAEFFRSGRDVIVSDACIACRGPVWSVKLLSRVPPAEIRGLALDEGSRTSAALVQVLLWERFGLRPRLEPLPIGDGAETATADAVLLIGDRAIHQPAGFPFVWDLGAEWVVETGLPFVFAVWAGRRGRDWQAAALAFQAARDAGLTRLAEIAAREAPRIGITPQMGVRYFRDNLHFTLGPRELQGLTQFRTRAAALGLVPPGDAIDLAPVLGNPAAAASVR